MHSPAAAIAWEFRRRHRLGLLALAAYFLVLAAHKLLILQPGQVVTFDDAQSFALVVVVPLSATFIYFLAVFTYGLTGDLAARQSTYPARMFTLPVTSAALAGWPMLYGAIAMTMLWLATRLLAIWPSDAEVPIVWPALLAASLLAWTQALTWMPYPLRGLRVIVTVLWLAVIDTVVLVALEYRAPEPLMLALLAPHVPLAYLVACFAIRRARRGDVSDWRAIATPLEALAYLLPRRRDQFPSPGRAQLWFEWRRHGRSLPALVGILLPFELALLFPFSDVAVIVFEVLLLVLLTPPFMAAFVAATVSKSNPEGRDSYGVTPFIATRPMTDAALLAAKLKMTIWSTLAAWLLVVIAVPVALRLSGAAPIVFDWARDLSGIMGRPRAAVIALLGFWGFVLSTWKQLVQSLYIGMSGREWLVKASVFLALSLLAIAFPFAEWVLRNDAAMAALWNNFPSILAVLVCLKISAAAWVAVRLYDTRALSVRTVVFGAVCWNVAFFALYGLLAWIFSTPHHLLALVAILAIPLARLSAAPLALAWNRHR